MKKQHHALSLVALALGLCLVAASGLENKFRVTNNSGEALEVGCTTTTGSSGGVSLGATMANQATVSNGTTETFTCAGTLGVQSSTELESSSFSCASGEIQHVTVTSSDGDLDLAEDCIDTTASTS